MESKSNQNRRQKGFTIIEMVAIIMIVGIITATASSQIFDANAFKSRGFSDQAQAAMRYAQKSAIAQRRNSCVALTSNSITLTIAASSGLASPCTTNLNLPSGSNTLFSPATGITLTYTSANFNFSGSGSTPTAQTIAIRGAPNSITVEGLTGYVHSP